MSTQSNKKSRRKGLASAKKINAFANSWLKKFADQNTTPRQLAGPALGMHCKALGFEMDCGHNFDDRYGCPRESETLENFFARVCDVAVLGSGIYSTWRFFNHWADSPDEISEAQNRAWFVGALGRLAALTCENAPADQVVRVCVEYQRDTHVDMRGPQTGVSDAPDAPQIPPQPAPASPQFPPQPSTQAIWHYTERLTIDRATQTLQHTQNVGPGCTVQRTMHVQDGISHLLDNINPLTLFGEVAETGNNVAIAPTAAAFAATHEVKTYTLTVTLRDAPERTLSGAFSKDTLPAGWPAFAQELVNFMGFYGVGEIIDPAIYSQRLPRATDHLFASVQFYNDGKTYNYLTTDATLVPGDWVVVPVGPHNIPTMVRVIDVAWYGQDNAPYPVEHTKHIIRKCTPEEVAEYEEHRASEGARG